MDLELLLHYCTNYEIEICRYTYGYEVNIRPDSIDESIISIKNKIENWAYDYLQDKIMDEFEILDTYQCKITPLGNDIEFNFEFNNSWEFDGEYGDVEFGITDLTGDLKDFLGNYNFDLKGLREDCFYLDGSYSSGFEGSDTFEIKDVWYEDGENIISFFNDKKMLEDLKNLILNNIKRIFYKSDLLEIGFGDGLSVYSIWKEKMKFSELFPE